MDEVSVCFNVFCMTQLTVVISQYNINRLAFHMATHCVVHEIKVKVN
jgi:hypothetical protein